MNLILLFPSDFISVPDRVRLTGRRLTHILEILKLSAGDDLTVGLASGQEGKAAHPSSGLIGTGSVVSIDGDALELDVSFSKNPPAKLPVILCVALMRPPVLKRVLQTAVSMGVSEIVIFHSSRVEKSFWQSTALKEDAIKEQLVLGLEQAGDTVFPQVTFQKKFKPFVEDFLPGLMKGSECVVADPSGESSASLSDVKPSVLVIGPEGGFISYEIEKFKEAGCRVVSLGDRIYKVETAMTVLLARIN